MICCHILKQNNFVSLIGLEEKHLNEAEMKIERYFARANGRKKIICKKLKAKFILKYLLPTSLDAIETPDGFEVSGPTAEIEKCEYFFSSAIKLQKHINYFQLAVQQNS